MIPRRLIIAIAITFVSLAVFFGIRAWVAAPKHTDYKKNLTLGSANTTKNIRYDSGVPRTLESVKKFIFSPCKPATNKPVVVSSVKKASLSKYQPKMAIILDDWGKNRKLLDTAIAIDRPLTLAVIPRLAYSGEIAKRAKLNGLGVMIHMPMQPFNPKAPMEPHTIRTTSTDGEILQYLHEAFESVPNAEGMNNHQGSAATSDERVMRLVIKELKKRNLFFIDSNTTKTTVAPQVSEEEGILFASRDVFIDNDADVELIKNQLRKAKIVALKTGKVFVIGHDKELTLQAIQSMIPEIEKSGVRLVLAKDILSREKH